MRTALWIFVAALFVAIAAPAASADQYLYSFAGACYFAGTNVSFTTNGPAEFGTDYTPNPGSTDEFAQGGNGYAVCDVPPATDEGTITSIYFADSPYDFCGGSSPCTVQMYLVTAEDVADGPTFAGLTVPDTPGTYDSYFLDNGVLTITDITTAPEPSSLGLLLCGLVLLVSNLVVRKRDSVVQGQAS